MFLLAASVTVTRSKSRECHCCIEQIPKINGWAEVSHHIDYGVKSVSDPIILSISTLIWLTNDCVSMIENECTPTNMTVFMLSRDMLNR